MGYQALLFCPDEKTARTVTQVLSELDFEVVPCSEPFAAVKKLMAEHFDAVVVDCDNEQNATLLFKSARNTANNQSALAVAVVEGQAGVAKAFRIGANLVLTKPINVEQAKGTLRVARGLLRKNEGAKAGAADAAARHSASPSTPVKPAPRPPSATPSTPRPVASPMTFAKPVAEDIPVPQSSPRSAAASASNQSTEVGEQPVESGPEAMPAPIVKPAARVSKPQISAAPKFTPKSAPTSAPRVSASSHSPVEPETKPTSIKISESGLLSPVLGVSAPAPGISAGAASAPAPAREPQPAIQSVEHVKAAAPEIEGGATTEFHNDDSSTDAPSMAPAPSFSFGGNVGSAPEPAKGGNKNLLMVAAAVVLVAAGGYGAWTLWGKSQNASKPSAVLASPVTYPAKVQPALGTAIAAASSPSDTPAIASTLPSSASPHSADAIKSSSENKSDVSANNAPAPKSKPNPAVASVAGTRTAASANESSGKNDVAPIVIKKSVTHEAPKSASISDASIPSLTAIGSAGSADAMPNLMGKASAPTPVLQTLHVSQGVSRGLLVKQAQPSYPASAVRLRIEGNVELMATISKAGDITAVKLLSGDSNLAHAAVDAVKQWKYKPYLLNGEPVEIQTQITVKFKLPS